MTAVWQASTDEQGRTWVGRTERQEWADLIIAVPICVIGMVLLIVVRGEGWIDVAVFGTIGIAAACVVSRQFMTSKSRRRGLLLSAEELEIHQGPRVRRLSWNEIREITVEHRPFLGGDFVVVQTTKKVVLPGPVCGRRVWTSWMGDPDFDTKVAHLRAHLPTSA